MRFLGNLIWLLFGGLLVSIGYVLGGLLLCLTIIGIPFGVQCFKIAGLALWPFGYELAYKEDSPGCLGTVMNILWILFGGIEICLTHIVFGLILCLTVIGIPWGTMHFKLAGLALVPFGRTFVRKC